MPTPNAEVNSPHDLGSPEYSQELTAGFSVLSSHIGKWLAIATFASQPHERLSFWDVSKIIDAAQGDRPGYLLTDTTSNHVRQFCEYSFEPGGLVEGQIWGEHAGWQTKGYQITERGMTAASVAGLLIKLLLDHPDKDIPTIFRQNTGTKEHATKGSLSIVMAMEKQSLIDFVPINLLVAGKTSLYDSVDHLVAVRVLDRVSKDDKDQRTFIITSPKIDYSLTRVSQVVRQLYDVAMRLKEMRITKITGTQLLDEVETMFPDADRDAVWLRLTNHRMPVFLKSELHPAFRKSTDKVAVRVNAAYTKFIEEPASWP